MDKQIKWDCSEIPETDAERILLRSMWRHGRMITCNGVADASSTGFAVAWRMGDDQKKAKEKND